MIRVSPRGDRTHKTVEEPSTTATSPAASRNTSSAAETPEQPRPDSVTGPVAPTAAAAGMHRPVTMSRLDTGLLHDWQQRNLSASLPLALRQLENAGNLDNVRLAVRSADRQPRSDGTDSRDGATPT